MIFQYDFIAFEAGKLQSVIARFHTTLSYLEPAQRLVDFHQVYRSDALLDRDQARYGL